eukprot:m.14463 g.14463  ORF g.14463 m.14463 type:complete len:87 (+) comp10451_c0_seq1:263-523(+)
MSAFLVAPFDRGIGVDIMCVEHVMRITSQTDAMPDRATSGYMDVGDDDDHVSVSIEPDTSKSADTTSVTAETSTRESHTGSDTADA